MVCCEFHVSPLGCVGGGQNLEYEFKMHSPYPSACSWPNRSQDIPTLVTLPHPLPAGIPSEQDYIRMYCASRGLPYPLQVSLDAAHAAELWPAGLLRCSSAAPF